MERFYDGMEELGVSDKKKAFCRVIDLMFTTLDCDPLNPKNMAEAMANASEEEVKKICVSLEKERAAAAGFRLYSISHDYCARKALEIAAGEQKNEL